nr:MAG TPA: hypothetical protein [Caudoviricetes sp.]
MTSGTTTKTTKMGLNSSPRITLKISTAAVMKQL